MSKLLYSATNMELEILDLHNRIEQAKNVLASVQTMPDAGTHRDPNCHRYHLDCLVVKLRSIIEG